MRVNYPYVCGLDWLQVFCFLHCNLDELPSEIDGLSLVCDDYPTAQFLRRAVVSFRDGGRLSPFAQILFKPRLSSLRAESAMLKVYNNWLYTSSWFPRLQRVFTSLDIEYRSVSRVDVFYDCNKFKNGLLPKSLIEGFVNGKFLKIGISRGTISFKDWGYSIPISSSKIAQSVRFGSPNINAITFGVKGYIQTQIYNKSLEMRDKKWKQWIADAWSRAGLDPRCVWRTEIRIQGNGKSVQLLDSGDLFSLSPNDILNELRIVELFYAYAQKHVRFVRADYHRKRQQMSPLDLFCFDADIQPAIKPKINRVQCETSRTLNLVCNYLDRAASAVRSGELNYDLTRFDLVLRGCAFNLREAFKNYPFDPPTGRINPELRAAAQRLLNFKWQDVERRTDFDASAFSED